MSLRSKNEPRIVVVKNAQLFCPVCGCDQFLTRKAQLNTAVRTFFNLDWTNRSACCYICANCTHISWFLEAQ